MGAEVRLLLSARAVLVIIIQSGFADADDLRVSRTLDNRRRIRERLLLGSVTNLTGYRKYGEPLEAYQRYAMAFDLPNVESIAGEAPVEALED